MGVSCKFKKAIGGMVRALSLLFWVLIIFAFNVPYVAVLTVLSALIHEAGHLIPLVMMGKYKKPPRSTLSGFRITVPEVLSYNDSILVLVFGPLANIISALLLYLASLKYGEYWFVFALLNLLTAISNLIPVKGYDGYKILEVLCSLKEENTGAKRVLEATSLLMISIMTFISLYFIMKIGEGYWIFFVFFISLLVTITKSKSRGK